MFKGYVEMKGKRPTEPIKGRTEFSALEDVKDLQEYGGVLSDDIILVDVDNMTEAEQLNHIINDMGIQCTKIQTTRGMHFYFKNTGVRSNSIHKLSAIGITVDTKLGSKNAVVPLKIKGKVRPMTTTGEIDLLPRWLRVVSRVPSFTSLEEGDGRNQTLFNYILNLQKHGFTKGEVKDTLNVINKYILSDSLSDAELKIILRDDAFTENNFFVDGKWSHNLFTDYLRREYNIILINKTLHAYIDGVYIGGTYEIERLIVKHIPTLTKAKRSEVLALLQITAHETQLSEPDKIVVNNGLLNLKTLDLEPFTPDYIALNKIPIDYNPDAASPVVDHVLNKICCKDTKLRLLVEEMVGYPLLRRPEMGKCFILTGKGSNGKSTLLDMITEMLGDNNISSIGMEELEQRFKTAEIVGKLANIGDDISNGYMAENSKFKKLVTGEPIMVEKKGVDPYKIKNYGKLIFSANEVPRVNDTSNGLSRRLILVPFNARFKSTDPDYDPFIKDKLLTRESLEYLLLLGIQGLRRILYENHMNFTNVDSVIKELQEYEKVNNPVVMFIDEHKIENEEVQYVYNKYMMWCTSGGMKPLNRNKFVRELTSHGYKTKQVRVGKEMKAKGITKDRISVFELINENGLPSDLNRCRK